MAIESKPGPGIVKIEDDLYDLNKYRNNKTKLFHDVFDNVQANFADKLDQKNVVILCRHYENVADKMFDLFHGE